VYLPTMVAAADLLERRLVRVLPEYAAPPLWLSAVYPTSHRSTSKVKAFVDFLRARFQSEPQWDKALGMATELDSLDDNGAAEAGLLEAGHDVAQQHGTDDAQGDRHDERGAEGFSDDR
jgi:hypothetical protein